MGVGELRLGMRRLNRAREAFPEAIALDPPGDDPLGVDANQWLLAVDRLGSAANLDPARLPRVGADEVVHHDRRPAAASGVTEFLRLGEVRAAHVDRILLGIANRRDSSEL